MVSKTAVTIRDSALPRVEILITLNKDIKTAKRIK